jgi:4'-phosphopantetheinyl transferase
MATVRVWVAPLLVPDSDHASLVDGLSAAERARGRRFRSATDARRFCAGRGWLRGVLAAELGCRPAAVPLVDGAGKPCLAGTGPHFSLSRAGDLVVIAVASREVGVDVEVVAGETTVLEAARVACTPSEARALDRLQPGARAEAFLGLWTAKEAYLKGRGVGLAVAPDRVEVGVEGADGLAPVRLAGETGPPRWWLRRLSPAPGYLGAVAAEGRGWDVEVRRGTVASMVAP